jgi:hypothetical protein
MTRRTPFKTIFTAAACALFAAFAILATVGAGSASAHAYRYVYRGRLFQKNELPGATNIRIVFLSAAPLAPSTTYGVASPIFREILMTDGVDTIERREGTFLDTSFIETNSAGQISSWSIIELAGVGRSFADPGQCCTINDPPLMYSIDFDGQTDATIQTNGFFGIGPNTGYAYNNLRPGVWLTGPPFSPAVAGFDARTGVPEPSDWALILTGFAGLGGIMRWRRGAASRGTLAI